MAGGSSEIRRLLLWLGAVPFALVILLISGHLARYGFTPPSGDIRSLLEADYGRWVYQVVQPPRTGIIDEIVSDQQDSESDLAGFPFKPGEFWATSTQQVVALRRDGALKNANFGRALPRVTAPALDGIRPTPVPPSSPPTSAPAPTPSASPTQTRPPAEVPTLTPTQTAAPTNTESPIETETPRPTPTPKESPSPTNSPEPTATRPAKPTSTKSPSPTAPPTRTSPPKEDPTRTPIPTATKTPKPSPSATATKTAKPANPATPTRVKPAARLSPFLDGSVIANSDGSCTAWWGYHNPNQEKIKIDVGGLNHFAPEPLKRGQPTQFDPGTHHKVFSTTWSSGVQLIWHLDSNKDTAGWCQPKKSEPPAKTTAPEPTATHTPPPAPTETPTPRPSPSPTQKPLPTEAVKQERLTPIQDGSVIANSDGSCTAWWGYRNPNGFMVDLDVGGLNHFVPGSQDQGQPVEFDPGTFHNVFSITWSGEDDLTWHLDSNKASAEWCHPKKTEKPPKGK